MTVREWTLDDEIFITIDNEDGSHLTMTKAEYDRQQAQQSTPMIPGDE